LFLCGVTLGLLSLGNAAQSLASFGIFYGLPLLTLVVASFGLWRMRKWGGLLYAFYLGWEAVRSLLIGSTLPVVFLPIGFALVDTHRGQAMVAQYNGLYFLLLVCVGVGVSYLWIRGRLS
jgi:hypothetical protein